MYTCTLRQGLSVCAPTIVNPLPGVYLPPTANWWRSQVIGEEILSIEERGGREGEKTIQSCNSVRETCPFQSEMTLSMEYRCNETKIHAN